MEKGYLCAIFFFKNSHNPFQIKGIQLIELCQNCVMSNKKTLFEGKITIYLYIH